MKFGSLTEFREICAKLDEAQERENATLVPKMPISEHSVKISKRYKSIWNLNTDTEACVATKKYSLIQHRDAFNAVADVLEKLGLDCFGRINNGHDRVSAMIAFKKPEYNLEIGGDEIKIGVMIENSYNCHRSFCGEVFAFRSVCSNGMFFGLVFGDAKLKKHHIGIADIKKLVEPFVLKTAEVSKELQSYIESMMSEKHNWGIVQNFVEKFIDRKKLREQVIAQLKMIDASSTNREITNWELYNTLTWVASHNPDLKESAVKYLQEKAQRLMLENSKIFDSVLTEVTVKVS